MTPRDPLIDAMSRSIAKYRIALAGAIRRPMGVIPDSAVGLVTQADLEAAEERRPRAGSEQFRREDRNAGPPF